MHPRAGGNLPPSQIQQQAAVAAHHETPATDARGIVQVLMLLPGPAAAHFRMAAADVLVRFLGLHEYVGRGCW